MHNSLAKSLIIPPLIESNDAVMLAAIWTPGILVRISDTVENQRWARFSYPWQKKSRIFNNFYYVIQDLKKNFI